MVFLFYTKIRKKRITYKGMHLCFEQVIAYGALQACRFYTIILMKVDQPLRLKAVFGDEAAG